MLIATPARGILKFTYMGFTIEMIFLPTSAFVTSITTWIDSCHYVITYKPWEINTLPKKQGRPGHSFGRVSPGLLQCEV